MAACMYVVVRHVNANGAGSDARTPNGFAGEPNPQPRASFNSSIVLRNGHVFQAHRRERHQLLFDRETGEPMVLFNGTLPRTVFFRINPNRSACGTGVGTGVADFVFTAAQPIRTSKDLRR